MDEKPARHLLLLSVPPCIVGALAVTLTLLGLAGRNPFWPRTDVTLSEAAALRDQATLVTLLEDGADPNAAHRIRAGLIEDEQISMTPVEAAIHEDRSEILHLLLTHGAEVSQGAVCRWLELAREREADDAREYLMRRYPEWSAACAQ